MWARVMPGVRRFSLQTGIMHPKRIKPFICFIITSALFVLCVGAHASLYFNFNFPAHFPRPWLALHLSIITPFLIRVAYKHKPTFTGPAAYVDEPAIVSYVAVVLIISSLLYAMFNFAYYEWIMDGGYPKIVGGDFVLCGPKDFVIRKLTAPEFNQYELYQARKVSGHWMIFHALPLYQYYDWLTDRV